MSSATASTYTCTHDGAVAGGSAADRRRSCARPHPRQHAQCDVAFGAAVLRQPAQWVLAHHRRHLRFRSDVYVLRAHGGAAQQRRRGVGCAARRAAVSAASTPRSSRTAWWPTTSARSSTSIPRSIGCSSTAPRQRRTSFASPASTGRCAIAGCRPPARRRPCASKTSWRPGEKRWPARTPAACAAPTAAPSRSARRATAGWPRRMACPRVESTSERRPRRDPTARPRQAAPSR